MPILSNFGSVQQQIQVASILVEPKVQVPCLKTRCHTVTPDRIVKQKIHRKSTFFIENERAHEQRKRTYSETFTKTLTVSSLIDGLPVHSSAITTGKDCPVAIAGVEERTLALAQSTEKAALCHAILHQFKDLSTKIYLTITTIKHA